MSMGRCTDPMGKGCTREPRVDIMLPGTPCAPAKGPCASCAAILMHQRRKAEGRPIRTTRVAKERL